MTDYRKYEVWRAAHALVLEVYASLERFPREERFALTEQLRRCVASIPSNIAEALGRSADRERAHLINIARGSAAEVDYQLLLARDLGYLTADRHAELMTRLVSIRRMLAGLHGRMRGNRQRQR